MMKKVCFLAATGLAALGMWTAQVQAGVAYSDPVGGWTYLYTGEQAIGDDPFASLDETWDHENGSDAWDGLPIGDPDSAPGGVSSITEGDVIFSRFDDTGDPRTEGYEDPSNRKIYLTHDISDEDPTGSLLLDGVTLTMRTRLATTGLLDSIIPPGGDGYYILDGGKANFSVRSGGDASAIVSFALATSTGDDLAENASGALLMNNYSEVGDSGDVNSNSATNEHREYALSDPTAWNEFWITIQDAGEPNQFQVDIYANGSTTAETFVVTGGNGSDGSFPSYLGMGVHSTGQHGAMDVDFFGYKPGILLPTSNVNPGVRGDFNGDGTLDATDIDALTTAAAAGTNAAAYDVSSDGRVDFTDISQWIRDLKQSWVGDANLDGQFNSGDLVTLFSAGTYENGQAAKWTSGDFNGDGLFTTSDLVSALSDGGYERGPRAAVAAVPEPTGVLLFAIGLLGGLAARRGK